MPILTPRITPNVKERKADEALLAKMAAFERLGCVVWDDEGEVPLAMTLAQIVFGSDEAAEHEALRTVSMLGGDL